MASLAQLPKLVGFFSYSRNDDEGDDGAVLALANRIFLELRAQLGRNTENFKLWRDQDVLSAGERWKDKLKEAVFESAFFIQMVTPSAVRSPFYRFELESVFERERELCRDDLVFPILYISVPELEDKRQETDPVLSTIAKRQYVDWRPFRHRDVNSVEVKQTVEQFCSVIAETLNAPLPDDIYSLELAKLSATTSTEENKARKSTITGTNLSLDKIPLHTGAGGISRLADLSNLVGFFSYSRMDDGADNGGLTTLGNCIYRELLLQLGRTPENFKVWRDKDILARGEHREELKNAAAESVFFIMMVSPSSLISSSCGLELDVFLQRQRQLNRDDLIFPVLYISVPELERHRTSYDPALLLVRQRQYLDWRKLRHHNENSALVKKAVAEFCDHIVRTLERPWDPLEQQATVELQNEPSFQDSQQEVPSTVPGQTGERADLGGTATPGGSRNTPEYWLHRVAVERKLTPGDQPLVLISFASDDQKWVDDLRDYLDAKMEILTDKHGQPYHLWNYSDAKHGTRVGDEFPEIVAEKMWCCQAAILLFSRAYFRSDYCKQIELPFLLWRRDHHKLMCLPIKIGTPSYEKVRIPKYECESRYVILKDLVDDRQAAEKFTESQYRTWDLGRLRQEGKHWDIEQRLAGVAHHIAEFLKANCSAVEVG